MKINKWISVVSAINIALLGLAIYVFELYQHRTSIVASQTPIANFSILEVNCRKLGSSVKIAYNGKEYYTAIPIPIGAAIIIAINDVNIEPNKALPAPKISSL